jgi:hypothetical protein
MSTLGRVRQPYGLGLGVEPTQGFACLAARVDMPMPQGAAQGWQGGSGGLAHLGQVLGVRLRVG